MFYEPDIDDDDMTDERKLSIAEQFIGEVLHKQLSSVRDAFELDVAKRNVNAVRLRLVENAPRNRRNRLESMA